MLESFQKGKSYPGLFRIDLPGMKVEDHRVSPTLMKPEEASGKRIGEKSEEPAPTAGEREPSKRHRSERYLYDPLFGDVNGGGALFSLCIGPSSGEVGGVVANAAAMEDFEMLRNVAGEGEAGGPVPPDGFLHQRREYFQSPGKILFESREREF